MQKKVLMGAGMLLLIAALTLTGVKGQETPPKERSVQMKVFSDYTGIVQTEVNEWLCKNNRKFISQGTVDAHVAGHVTVVIFYEE